MSSLASASISYLIYLFVSIRFWYEFIIANWLQGSAAVYSSNYYYMGNTYFLSCRGASNNEPHSFGTGYYIIIHWVENGYNPFKCVYGQNEKKNIIKQANWKSPESPVGNCGMRATHHRQNWTSIHFFGWTMLDVVGWWAGARWPGRARVTFASLWFYYHILTELYCVRELPHTRALGPT